MKKTLSLILALLTLALGVLPIFGCSDTTQREDDTTSNSITGEKETEDPFDDKVPTQDFNEREFLIMLPYPEDLGANHYVVEEDSGDSIVSAIYTRNAVIEDRFNITIDTISAGDSGTQTQEFQSYALSQEDKIDLLCVTFTQSAKPLIINDMILPWNDVPYINVEKDWWNKSVTETLSLLGNYYLLVGDVNWTTMRETLVCFFNKEVAAENKSVVGDLYQTVRDQEWTWDACLNAIKGMAQDDGNGAWNENATYGAVMNLTSGSYGLIYSCNFQTVVLDDAKGPIIQYNTNKMVSILNIAKRLLKDNHNTYAETFDFANTSKGIPIFFDNRALLFFGLLRHGESFREEKTDYGIIPYPKYDEAQKNYVTQANQWGLSCALPRTATDLERTGSILEAMSALSRKLIVPAYYEKTLMGKVKRDDESEEMLDIIFSNILYDFGFSYLEDFGLFPVDNLWQGNTAILSWYRKNEKKITNNYWELYEHVYESVNGVKPEKS